MRRHSSSIAVIRRTVTAGMTSFIVNRGHSGGGGRGGGGGGGEGRGPNPVAVPAWEAPRAAQSEGRYYAFGPDGFTGEISQGDFDQRRQTKRWQAFDGLSRKELFQFSFACNKAFTNLLGHNL